MLQPQFAFTHPNAIITDANLFTVTVRTPSGNTQALSGFFMYNSSGIAPGSSISELTEYTPGGSLIYDISGFYLPIETWAVFVVNSNAAGMRSFLFSGTDSISGSSSNDRLMGLGGNDSINGHAGFDTAVFLGNLSDYSITKSNGQVIVTDLRGIDGTDTLNNIEQLQFANATISTNSAPVAVGGNYTPGHTTMTVPLTSIVSFSDADGDAVQLIEIFDNTAGGGRFSRNGVLQPEKQGIVIDVSDFANYEFVTDGAVTNSVSFRAYDGRDWGAWHTFNINPRANALPVIAAPDLTPAKTAVFIAGANLFGVSDGDGDTITRYRFYDGTLGNGRFMLNGVAQVELANFEIAAADLASFGFETSATGESTLWVQAYDGLAWGAWKSFTVAPRANSFPMASVNTGSLDPAKGTSTIAASSFFSVSDNDGDTITQYKFFDGTAGNGRFELNGVQQVESSNITVNAADLADFRFRLGAGSDVLWVQAFDGTSWSTWQSFTVQPPQNIAPIASINTGSLNPAKGTTTIAAANFFSATDGDGDSITQYKFFDGTAGNGRFELNGVQQVELANITVDAADLANFQFRLGAGNDTLWVQAFDGISWSTWKSFVVAAPANVAPTVNVQVLSPAKTDAFIAGSALFTVTDPDDASMAKYRFFDGNTGNGRFQLNGVDQVELADIEIDAADLANFRYRTSTTGAGDVLWVQAFDGTAWGAWKSFMANAPVNVAPTVTVQALNPSKSTPFIAGAALFTVSDPDDASMTKYRFFDGNTDNGRFQLNGADQAELANIEINAADLANFRYRTSTTGAGDLLWVQAFDGFAWGAWKSFMVSAPVNIAPVVNVQTVNPSKTTAFIAGANLFTVTDPDDASITRVRFFDGNAGNGRFQLNGVDQIELSNIEIDAAELASFRYRTSTTGAGDTLWIQVYDGFAWSAWKSFMANAPVNAAPVVNVSDRQGVLGFVASASALFTVSDADNDTMTRYQFWDSTPGQGHFRVNGVEQAVNTAIDIAASDLVNTQYVVSSNEGSQELLWVRAHDGTTWGEWKSLTITAVQSIPGGSVIFDQIRDGDVRPIPLDPEDTTAVSSHAPVVAATNTNLAASTVTSLASLLSASDPDGDAITAWQVWDSTLEGGAVRIGGVDQPEIQPIDIMANQLAAASFVTSEVARTDTLWARASDGTHWGAWQKLTLTTLAPV